MPAHPCHIAIVEDDAGFSRAIARLLRVWGFEARTFTSAEAFLASASPELCPCLILDIQLPGMSGFELLAHLGTLAPPRPAIFVTAQKDGDADEQLTRFQGSVLLRKPVLGAELVAAVRAQLRRAGYSVEPET